MSDTAPKKRRSHIQARDTYRLAFAAYLDGEDLPAIAERLGIGLEVLAKRAQHQGWAEKRDEMLSPHRDVARQQHSDAMAIIEAKLEVLKNNRRISKAEADKLTEHVEGLIKDLLANKLTTLKVGFHQGQPIQVETPIGTADLVNIAKYVTLVQQMRYRAIGDVENNRAREDSPTTSTSQAITVILPPCVAMPRTPRDEGPKPVDIESTIVTQAVPKAPSNEPLQVVDRQGGTTDPEGAANGNGSAQS